MLRLILSLILLVWLSNGQGKYIQVCEVTEGPYPNCTSVRMGEGLEIADGELRAVPTTNGKQIVDGYWIVLEEDAKRDRVLDVPNEFKGQSIDMVSWGNTLMMRVGPMQTDTCSECWSLAGDKVMFGMMNSPIGVKRAVVVKFQKIE